MSRLAERRFGALAYNAGSSVDVLDPIIGGQQGFSSDIANYESNHAHKMNQLIAVLMQAPRGFRFIAGGEKHVAALKAIVELRSLRITGFSSGLTVDVDQHTVGSAGQVQQEFTNVTREQPTPVHSFVDIDGRPIQKFFNFWIRYLMQDPDSNHPLLPIVGTRNIRSMGPEMYAMSVLYFEPNVTWTGINRAYLCVNMWPHGDGTNEARRDLTQGAELLQYDITFSALTQVGFGVDELSLGILNKINTLNADNFFRQAAVGEISADVKAASDTGFVHGVEKLGSEAITNVFGINQ